MQKRFLLRFASYDFKPKKDDLAAFNFLLEAGWRVESVSTHPAGSNYYAAELYILNDDGQELEDYAPKSEVEKVYGKILSAEDEEPSQ